MKYTIIVNHKAPTSKKDVEIMQKIEHDMDKLMKNYELKKSSDRVNLPDETHYIYEK